jgi:glycine cleavage system H protein
MREKLMNVEGCDIPEELYYSKEHEWVLVKKDHVVVGITDYAQKALHEIVYVELPKVESKLNQMQSIGTVESVKAVSEVFTPITGEVTEVNEKLVESPELLNRDPYKEGWVMKVRPTNLKKDLEKLMTAQQYAECIKKLKR